MIVRENWKVTPPQSSYLARNSEGAGCQNFTEGFIIHATLVTSTSKSGFGELLNHEE